MIAERDLPMPASVEAEKSALGAVLFDNDAYSQLAISLRAEDFYLESHQRIFSAMVGLIDAGMPIDTITLAEEISRKGHLEAIGGSAYLANLTDGLPRSANIKHYANTIRDKAKLRKMIDACQRAINVALEQTDSARSTIGWLSDDLLAIQADDHDEQSGKVSQFIPAARAEFERRLSYTHEVLGRTFGIPAIDEQTAGLMEGELCLIGGRPSSGKTYWACQIALANLALGRRPKFFSLEMRQYALLKRMAGMAAQIPMWKLRDERKLNPGERDRFRAAMDELEAMQMFVDFSSALTTQQLTAKAVLAVKRDKCDLLLVDYAQLLQANGKDEVERSLRTARSLAQFAKDYCPVVGLVQLSRAPEHNMNKWPNMQEIKGSSQYEQDANIIFLLHRPVDKEGQPTQEDVVVIEKQREGAKGLEEIMQSETGHFRSRTTLDAPVQREWQRGGE